jgi:hypothetical protein
MKFKGFDDWIEIFRGGKQTDSDGVEHDGDALIDKAVDTFDTSYHEPPLVIGHPKHDDPAYGWVEGLKKTVKDGVNILHARFKDVVPEFIDAAKSGLYKKRSVRFYSDGRLRHVGVLGAAPPSVKGLNNVAFSDDDPGIGFEFSETSPWTWETVARVFRRLREYIIEKDSKETADAIIPDWDVDYIRDEATKTEEKESDIMKFSEFLEAFKFWKKMETDPNTDLPIPATGPASGAKTFTEADIEAAKEQAAKEEREKADADFADKERQSAQVARNKEISDFCDALVAEKKVPPSWAKSGLVEFMQNLNGEKEISFAEGEDKKSSLKWFKDFLEGFEKSPIFKEMATKEAAGGGSEFAEAEKDEKTGESIAAKVNS